MSPIVQVQGLPGTMNRGSVAHLLQQFGIVVSTEIQVDRVTGRSLHSATVRFETTDGSARALAAGSIIHHQSHLVIHS